MAIERDLRKILETHCNGERLKSSEPSCPACQEEGACHHLNIDLCFQQQKSIETVKKKQIISRRRALAIT